MWESLGFRKDPYDASPLRPTSEDVELLIGREEEGHDLCTTLESCDNGVCILSGVPGVGKTSFLNIYQLFLERGDFPFGPRAMCARTLCAVQQQDSPRDIAIRALHSLCRSVEQYAHVYSCAVPNQTKTISGWLNSKGDKGYSIGITIAGFGGNFGRSTTIPSVSDVSFEGIADALSCVAQEASQSFSLDGVILALDNVENLDDESVASTLMAFRDTLFSTPHIWWLLIGQSGFGSLLQTLDPRVSDRLAGTQIELKPISFDELDTAIKKRVEQFHSMDEGKAPLPTNIHKSLYDASHGEIRFVFKYSSVICQQFVTEMRRDLMNQINKSDVSKKESFDKHFNKAMGEVMVESQIPEDYAFSILNNIVENELSGLNLRQKDKDVLRRIGKQNGARAKEFKEFGFKSMQDFSSNYLTKFYKLHLLTRRQEGRAVVYNLRGVMALGAEFGLLD